MIILLVVQTMGLLLPKDVHCRLDVTTLVSLALNEKGLPSLADEAMLNGLVSEISDDTDSTSALAYDNGESVV